MLKNNFKKILKTILWVISMAGVFLFLGVFRSEYSTIETLLIGFLCILFGVAPFFLRRLKTTALVLKDERNTLILGLGSLFFIYCISEALLYDSFVLNVVVLITIGALGFLFSIHLVKGKHLGQPQGN